MENSRAADELREVLEKIFEAVQEKLPPGVDKDTLIDGIVNSIDEESLDLDMLKDPQKGQKMREVLTVKMISAATAQVTGDKKFEFDCNPLLKLLKDPELINDPAQKKDLQMTLKAELVKLLKAVNEKNKELNPEAKLLSDKEIDMIADRLAHRLMNDNQKDELEKSEEVSNTLSNLALCSMFGGIDPTKQSGQQPIPPQQILGNIAGFVNVTAGGGRSQMSDENTPDPGKVDYTGTEALEIANFIAIGDLNDELDKLFEQRSGNWPPRPTGPGGIQV